MEYFYRATETDGSQWVNAEAFDAALATLRRCVEFWPAALNDDLQTRTFEDARAFLERLDVIVAEADKP